MTLHIAQVSTPVGWFNAQIEDGAVRTATFADAARDERDPFGVYDALVAYFDGDVDALAGVPVSPTGTTFQQGVWAALRTIPAGTTCSYRDIAARVGAPLASRAVGRANATNPVPLFIPCHRVVRADGQLGGFGFGLECKQWLIDHEETFASPYRKGSTRKLTWSRRSVESTHEGWSRSNRLALTTP